MPAVVPRIASKAWQRWLQVASKIEGLSPALKSGRSLCQCKDQRALSDSHNRWHSLNLTKQASSYSTTSASQSGPHFCVVGSGPAGFYTAEMLLKRNSNAKVDILERLPTPFGLVRSGVAPDHPETKNVINQFTRLASGERCTFIGNVKLGRDLSLEELRAHYHAVVLAYGAEGDRRLEVPGEGLRGVLSAREVVWWYNGHPEYAELPIDLTSTDTAVILGQGNVALDVARVLLRNVDELAATDIAEHAVQALRRSTIRRVCVVGRRGPAQAACTAKELRELLNLEGVHVRVREADMAATPADEAEMKKSRSHKRVHELLAKAATKQSPPGGGVREIDFVFFRAPVEVLPAGPEGRVGGIRVEKTRLEGGEGGSPQKAVGTGEQEDLPCGLLLRSIGYKSLPLPGLPFDHRRGIVPNVAGRVRSGSPLSEGRAEVEPGLYVVGWLKRGPTGIIGTNLIDAEETVGVILEDTEGKMLPPLAAPLPGISGLQKVLEDRGVQWVSFQDWLRIDVEEVRRGLAKGKPREKIIAIEEMLRVARGQETVLSFDQI